MVVDVASLKKAVVGCFECWKENEGSTADLDVFPSEL